MPYTHTTFGALKTQLAARLQDTAKVFFVDDELGVYLTEALRTFSFFCAYWRNQASFNTVVGEPFYDITLQLPALLGRFVTDRNLINAIQYHFQEPPTTGWGGVWTGTEMFSLQDFVDALQRRRNQFLVETGVLITRTVGSSGVPSGGRITLADTVIDVRRLARNNTGVLTNLWRVNEIELTAFANTWSTAAAQDPLYFSILSPPPLTLQLAPAPSAAATIDMLSVSTGTVFTPTVAAAVVGVPDDMTWIVKWGAMASLLMKDGPAFDPARAEYCEKRYQHGVQLARVGVVLTAARINSVPVSIDTLANLDAYRMGWQSAANAAPDILATAGLNYIVLAAPPNAIVPITLDVIQNAPIPANDAAFVEIGREMLSAILDYAEHLAMFKVAGEEFQSTNSCLEKLFSMAANSNNRMAAASRIWKSLHNITNAEEPMRQRIEQEQPVPQQQGR